jgi:hypothetical protein
MKRTAKWMKSLTMKELRHMKAHQHTVTLREFAQLRRGQRDMAKRLDLDLWRMCFDCDRIEGKLLDAGHLKAEDVGAVEPPFEG